MSKTITICKKDGYYIASCEDVILTQIEEKSLKVDGGELLDSIVKLIDEKKIDISSDTFECKLQSEQDISDEEQKKDKKVMDQIKDLLISVFEGIKNAPVVQANEPQSSEDSSPEEDAD